MFVNPELIDKSLYASRSVKIQPAGTPESFQDVLNRSVNPSAVESAFASSDKNIKKRKKTTQERIEDYSDEIEDLYDVLELQSKIRRVFRKMRLEQ